MSGTQSGWGEGVDAMAQQVWETWGEALRKMASAPLESAAPAWQQVPGGWPGWTPPEGVGAGDVMERFDGMARHWFGRMQQVAARFADRDNTPAEIVAAWREALGATEARPYPDLFGDLFGQGATGLDGFSEQWMPWLESLRGPLEEWARTPAFGPAREHQQRWKTLLQTQQLLREANAAYQAMLEEASRQAYALFEEKLGARAGQGNPLDSARALFDEWIDAAEDAYARMALSEEFREVYGQLANAQMRMRAGLQREVEQLGGMLGLPTRSEVDAAHRKIAELERLLRRMMREPGAARAGADPAGTRAPPKRASTTGRPRAGATKGKATPRPQAAGKSPRAQASAKPAATQTTTQTAKKASKKAAKKATKKATAGKSTAASGGKPSKATSKPGRRASSRKPAR